MIIEFLVEGLPPKYDSAKSLWCNDDEKDKIKKLRNEALKYFDSKLIEGDYRYETYIEIYLTSKDHADLDNFVKGILDSLQPPQKFIDSINDKKKKKNCQSFLIENFGDINKGILKNDNRVYKIYAEIKEVNASKDYYKVRIIMKPIQD